jgi:hypothetical protein
MSRARLAAVVGFTALALASPALAADTPVADTPASGANATGSDPWKFVFAPYIWGASMEGTSVVKGQEASIDLSASDIFDHLELGFMSTVVARKRNWGITGDVVWVALGATTDVPVPADIDPTLFVLGVSGVRRINDWADVTFGARWNRVEGDIHVKPLDLDVSRNRDWVDPIVGMVLRTPGDHRWHGTLIADVGGFGIGSDLTWQVFPTVGFDLTKSKKVSMEFGWRLLDVDYDNGDESDPFEYDVRYQGPVAGVAIRF